MASSTIAGIRWQLRDAVSQTDRDAVRRLVERTGFFHADEVDVAVELVDERLARGEQSGYHFVFVETDGILAGYASFGPIPCTESSYDLYWIAVDPEFQRHGIGRMLMSAAESRIVACGGQRIYIDTSGRGQYAPTRAFYEACGFHREATLKDFYAASDDRLIYAKAGASRDGAPI